MGKIIVFTTNDINSKIAARALDSRKLPYTEISVSEYPSKVRELQALTGSYALPKVFFNTRAVGGVVEIIQEFRKWDFSRSYKTPLDRYHAEISPMPESTKSAFAVPDKAERKMETEYKLSVQDNPIPMCDGLSMTYSDIMEELKLILPMEDITLKGNFHKKLFTGQDLIKALPKFTNITVEQSKAVCQLLLDEKLIHPVIGCNKSTEQKFQDNKTTYYRLQCFMTPQILNSYRQQIESAVGDNPIHLVSYLFKLMNEIHLDCVDEIGMLDHTKCVIHPFYPMFENGASRLQTINIMKISKNERLAFSLNLYKLMLAYAFIKIGFPTTETDRIHFLTHVQFIISGNTFSFADWLDGILRGNKKGLGAKVPFARDDKRLQMAIGHLDRRIHLALNIGSVVGAPTSAPFTEFSAENIEKELDIAASVFFEDNHSFTIDKEKNEIRITKSVGVYYTDFASDHLTFVQELETYMTGSLQSQVRSLLGKQSSTPRIVMLDVHWHCSTKNFQQYQKDSLKVDITGFKALARRFRPPPDAPKESERMAALRNLKLLDTAAEDRFDRITRQVQEDLTVPIVLISLVDTNRQWFKSKQWACKVPEPNETGRDISFCGHAILQNEPFIINDALLDDRFADNPLVTGDLKIRFYAGIPLSVPGLDGSSHNIGTLCVIDQRPREITDSELRLLKSRAQEVKLELLRHPSFGGNDGVSQYFM